MSGFPTGRVLAWGLVGWGLRVLSKGLESLGDLAVERGDRLFYHVSALGLLVLALVCWFFALRAVWRFLRGEPAQTLQKVFEAPREEPASFDPDAALERYMASRPTPASAPAQRSGFGRKGS